MLGTEAEADHARGNAPQYGKCLKGLERERQLAHLLGHKVEEFYEDAGTLWDGTVAMPKWTREWAAWESTSPRKFMPRR